MTPSEQISPTTASPEYLNTPETQDMDLNLQLMMLIEGFKKDVNNSLKEIQETLVNRKKPLKNYRKVQPNK